MKFLKLRFRILMLVKSVLDWTFWFDFKNYENYNGNWFLGKFFEITVKKSISRKWSLKVHFEKYPHKMWKSVKKNQWNFGIGNVENF